jgi:transitional endoplasmic reticulum ATPase
MHAYEAAVLGRYARNLFAGRKSTAKRSHFHSGQNVEALAWLSLHRGPLNVPSDVFTGAISPAKKVAKLRHSTIASIVEASLFDGEYEPEDEELRLVPARAAKVVRTWARTPLPALPARISPLQKRINIIVETLDLSANEGDVLGLLMRINVSAPFRDLVKGIFDADWTQTSPFIDLVDVKWHEVGLTLALKPCEQAKITSRICALRRLGLVTPCPRDAELTSIFLQIAQSTTNMNQRALVQTMMGRSSRSSDAMTKWDDFAHIGPAREIALNLINGALATSAKGVVILLHGPPGTGKTAFAQTLIQQAGAKGWMVGETDDDGDEANRRERLSSLLLASALSKGVRNAVLVLDEADDVFNDGASKLMSMFAPSKARDGSKIFMNRALEDLQAPTILIVNDPSNLGDAIVRRMSLAIEIKTPNAALSAKIAARVLARQKLKVSPQTIADLAQSGTPPAVMALAARTAALTGGGADHLKLAARSVTRMLNIDTKPLATDLAGMGFDPAFANADCDLAYLANQAVVCGNRALSFCLYGAPGTGKSAFARWIAGRMGLDVIEKRASDLLGMYVGQSEKNIARAFEEAADTEAFLIFDEADSLLADRSHATKSWEVSQVDEMLTWMERHPLPFAATTNLMNGIDPAALRRFLFKAEFKPLLPNQARALFTRTFACEAPPRLATLDLLTPGDFAVVARKARVLGITNPMVLFEALQTEVALKPGATRVRVGF